MKIDDLSPDIPKTNPIWWSGRTGCHSCPVVGGKRSNGRKSHWPLTDNKGEIKKKLSFGVLFCHIISNGDNWMGGL